MNQTQRLKTCLLCAVLMLAACNSGTATPDTQLEPTRTPSSETKPRPTKAPATEEPAPQPTTPPRPLAKNAITAQNINKLGVLFSRDEVSFSQIFAAQDNRVVGVGTSSFGLMDADTLNLRQETKWVRNQKGTPIIWYTVAPQAQVAATMEQNGEVSLYDLENGTVVKTLTLSESTGRGTTDIALNDDGTQLVYANQTVQRYAIETGKEIGKPQELPKGTSRILFSENAARLSAILNTNEIFILDTRGGRKTEPMLELKTPFDDVDNVGFSPDGAWFVATSAEGKAAWWNLDAKKPDEVVAKVEDLKGQLLPAVNQQGTRVALIAEGVAHLYTTSGEKERELSMSNSQLANSAHFSADGDSVFVSSAISVERFRTSDGEPLQNTKSLLLTRSTFLPDGKRLLVYSTNNISPDVGVLDAETGETVARLSHEETVRFVILGGQGKHVAVLTRDGATHVWDLDKTSEMLTISASTSNARRGALCFTPDESALVFLDGDDIVLEPLSKTAEKKRFKLPEGTTSFAPCQNKLGHIGAVTDSAVNVLNLDGETVATFKLNDAADLKEGGVYQINNDGNIIAAVSRENLYIWNATASKPQPTKIKLKAPPLFLFSFNADGSRIDVNYGDGIDMVNTLTGKVTTLAVPTTPQARWLSVANSDNADILITTAMVSDEDTAGDELTKRNYTTGEITLWNTQTGKATKTLKTGSPIFSVSTNAEGTRLAASTRANGLDVWGVK